MFKGLLFLSTGSVLYATGTKDLNKLGGLMKLMPVTAVVAGIASLSIAGMPPSAASPASGPSSRGLSWRGDATGFLVMFGIVALFTSAVTLASYVKFFGMTFASSGVEWNVTQKIREVPASMLIPKIILAVLCLVQGLFPSFYGLIVIVLRHAEGSSADRLSAARESMSTGALGIRLGVLDGRGMLGLAPVAVLLVLGLAAGRLALLRRSGGSERGPRGDLAVRLPGPERREQVHGPDMYAAFKSRSGGPAGTSRDKDMKEERTCLRAP